MFVKRTLILTAALVATAFFAAPAHAQRGGVRVSVGFGLPGPYYYGPRPYYYGYPYYAPVYVGPPRAVYVVPGAPVVYGPGPVYMQSGPPLLPPTTVPSTTVPPGTMPSPKATLSQPLPAPPSEPPPSILPPR